VSRREAAGVQPLSPKRKWQAITLATLLLVPGYWSLLAGLVATAAPSPAGGGAGAGAGAAGAPNPTVALAFGLALLPFVFVVLAFASGHPRPAGAVVTALLMAVVVGFPVSALAGDAVTGIVAGVGAGGVFALRREPEHSLKARAVGVGVAVLYTFVLAHTAAALALLPAPVFPLTAIGLADHFVERGRQVAA
jgi:hypothetical protein